MVNFSIEQQKIRDSFDESSLALVCEQLMREAIGEQTDLDESNSWSEDIESFIKPFNEHNMKRLQELIDLKIENLSTEDATALAERCKNMSEGDLLDALNITDTFKDRMLDTDVINLLNEKAKSKIQEERNHWSQVDADEFLEDAENYLNQFFYDQTTGDLSTDTDNDVLKRRIWDDITTIADGYAKYVNQLVFDISDEEISEIVDGSTSELEIFGADELQELIDETVDLDDYEDDMLDYLLGQFADGAPFDEYDYDYLKRELRDEFETYVFGASVEEVKDFLLKEIFQNVKSEIESIAWYDFAERASGYDDIPTEPYNLAERFGVDYDDLTSDSMNRLENVSIKVFANYTNVLEEKCLEVDLEDNEIFGEDDLLEYVTDNSEEFVLQSMVDAIKKYEAEILEALEVENKDDGGLNVSEAYEKINQVSQAGYMEWLGTTIPFVPTKFIDNHLKKSCYQINDEQCQELLNAFKQSGQELTLPNLEQFAKVNANFIPFWNLNEAGSLNAEFTNFMANKILDTSDLSQSEATTIACNQANAQALANLYNNTISIDEFLGQVQK